MSFIPTTFRTTLRSQGLRLPLTTRPAVSALHTSSPRLAMKESDINRDELDAVYEAEKDDQVMNSKEGKARWKGELASNSEASVKADRGELESDGRNMNELQDRTKHLPNRSGPVNKSQ